MLLVAYAGTRLTLWLRGQVRVRMLPKTTAQSDRVPVEVPQHLTPALSSVFETADHARLALVHHLDAIERVMVTDPDAALGGIRDRRYREALMDAWRELQSLLRRVDSLDDEAAATLEDRGATMDRLRQIMATLREPWRRAARARALEPFPIHEVRRCRDTLADAIQEVRLLERRLERDEIHPYRGMGLAS